MLIVDAVLEEFERIYHHLLHSFPDLRSLVENRRDTESPVLYYSNERSHTHSVQSAKLFLQQMSKYFYRLLELIFICASTRRGYKNQYSVCHYNWNMALCTCRELLSHNEYVPLGHFGV